MTDRMTNTLNHIKTSVDVDPWASAEVERVFKAVDTIDDLIYSYVTSFHNEHDSIQYFKAKGLMEALDLLKGTADEK